MKLIAPSVLHLQNPLVNSVSSIRPFVTVSLLRYFFRCPPSLLFAGICWVCSSGAVCQESFYRLDPQTTSLKIQNFEYYLSDNKKSAEELARSVYEDFWQSSDTYSSNSDKLFREIHHWVRFDIERSTSDLGNWLVTLSLSHIFEANISVYDHDTGHWWHSREIGEAFPLSQRYLHHRYPLLPLKLQTGHRVTVYVRIHTYYLAAIPVDVWRQQDYLSRDQSELVFLGIFFGSMIIMLLYNLGLYFSLRDPAYLTYVAYVVGVILFQLANTGLGYYYFWEDHWWFSRRAIGCFAAVSFLCAAIFMRYFLNLKQAGGWVLHANNIFLVVWLLITVISIFVLEFWMGTVMLVASLLSCIASSMTGIFLWCRGVQVAKLFTCAWAVLIFSTVIYNLFVSGILPANWITRYSQMSGFMIEMVLLSFALAYRINLEQEQRESAQSEMLSLTKRVSDERNERLREQIRSFGLQKKLNDELERLVAQRTVELQEAMQKLETANSELTELSMTDPLTKISNRRHFDQVLKQECKRAHRQQQSLAIVVMDLDYFKSINDNLGHSAGDECLAKVAALLKNAVSRPGDLVARYGGEEFVFILPNTDEENAITVASNARRNLESLHINLGQEREGQLTLSAGVAARVPRTEKDYVQLLAAADNNLYRAKHAGRNCVISDRSGGQVARI